MTKTTPEAIIGWAGKTAAETVSKTALGGARLGEPTPVGGRPRTMTEPVQLAASIEATQMEKLRDLAKEWGCSVSAALRRIIETW